MDLVTLYKGEEMHPQLEGVFAWAEENIFRYLGEDSNPILAGGALRSYFTNTRVRDYDLYFDSNAKFATAFNSANSQGWRNIESTTPDSKVMALTRISGQGGIESGMINLISRRYFATPAEVISLYDFTVCMCGLNAEQISFHPDYFLDIATRKLRIHDVEDPLNTLWRIQKYRDYGYTMDREELWRVVEMVHSMPTLPNVDLTIKEPEGQKIPVQYVFNGS